MGKLSYLNSKFYFAAASSVEATAAKDAGLKWHDDSQSWVTLNFHKARALRQWADSSAERKFKRYFITDLAPPECIVYPDHLAPNSNQIDGAWHMLTRTPSYDADDPGLGKSATAIMAINSAPGSALIVCPPYLKYNWVDELAIWLAIDASVEILTPDFDLLDWCLDILVLPDSLLTHPKILKVLKREAPFKWLIVDEAHRFKTNDTKRTQALFGDEQGKRESISDLAERVVLLSGTPFPNGKPVELLPVLTRIAPESVLHRDAKQYWKEFCGGKTRTHYERGRPVVSRDFEGACNLEKLKSELQSKFMIRHTKEECLKDLAPKRRRLIFLDTPRRILRLDAKLLRDIAFEELLGSKAALGDIATYRREVGIHKIVPAVEYINEWLEDHPGKLVVAAYHINVVESLAERLSDWGFQVIRGGMTAKEKHRRIQEFKTNPKVRGILGNTTTMSLGLTLTEASHGVVVEPDWTPGVNEQMEDRIHRITQTRQVTWDYLVMRNSLDERMLRQALGKQENIHRVMN